MTNYDYTAQFTVTIAQNDSTGEYTAFVYKEGDKSRHSEVEACDEDPYWAFTEALEWIDEEAERLELEEEDERRTQDY